jgi:hypothetical protein
LTPSFGSIAGPEAADPQQLHGLFGIRKTADVLLLQVDEPDALAAALAAR